jgi:hypothetical protein
LLRHGSPATLARAGLFFSFFALRSAVSEDHIACGHGARADVVIDVAALRRISDDSAEVGEDLGARQRALAPLIPKRLESLPSRLALGPQVQRAVVLVWRIAAAGSGRHERERLQAGLAHRRLLWLLLVIAESILCPPRGERG